VDLVRLDDAPEPALLQAGIRHDLIVIGRDSTLGREEAEDGVAPVIECLLQDGAQPLLVVPPGPSPAPEAPVLVGYDGSRPAQRALHLFALLGMAEASPVTVLSASGDRAVAAALAAEGAAVLRRHGATVTERPVTGTGGGVAAELLLAEARALNARLLVMGAFGHSGLRALLLGAATRRLLRDAPCPLLVSH
jgi:nucleotide-binding universal stress UspA family protein